MNHAEFGACYQLLAEEYNMNDPEVGARP